MTPSGWKCEHLPYLVEIDNWGASRHPGQAKAGGIWVWGYDEITWFAHQSRTVSQRLAALCLGLGAEDRPGRPSPDARQPHVRSPLDGKRWYYANKPSPAVPNGLGDEAAIRAIWAADSAR